MTEIVVDDEQAKIIVAAMSVVAIRDRSGQLLGHVSRAASTRHVPSGFTDEDVEEARRDLASNQPRYTTQQVLERLQGLK